MRCDQKYTRALSLGWESGKGLCVGRGCLCLVGRGHKLELELVGCDV